MESLLEVLKYVLPSLVVFATAYLLIKSFFEDQMKRKEMELRHANKPDITPLRLQAYERIVLFLERISPHSLLPRLQAPGQTVSSLHALLLSNIRSEFEHNLSQQIYVSKEAWMVVKNAKESIIQLLNSSASRLNKDAQGFELSKLVLEEMVKKGIAPTDNAIQFLKQEIDERL